MTAIGIGGLLAVCAGPRRMYAALVRDGRPLREAAADLRGQFRGTAFPPTVLGSELANTLGGALRRALLFQDDGAPPGAASDRPRGQVENNSPAGASTPRAPWSTRNA